MKQKIVLLFCCIACFMFPLSLPCNNQHADYLKQIEKADAHNEQLKIPDFEKGLLWFNSKPLSLHNDLQGSIVLLDFWTYCCINCIHALPDLKALEEKYQKYPVVVIGVHSAKFDNEKDTTNVKNAVLRYQITHPVVHDPYLSMWQAIGVHAWPTYVIIGPKGNFLGSFSGEGNKHNLDLFLQAALDYYNGKKQLRSNTTSDLSHNRLSTTNQILQFPSKLCFSEDQSHLFISDSSHNRIIEVDTAGKIQAIIGSGKSGLQDGTYEKACFNFPQGICCIGDYLYVADCQNHAIRTINYKKKTVTTLAGDGTQGRDYKGGKIGTQQAISSPWDLATDGKNLYIAMAGLHQIWSLDLMSNKIAALSGNGSEMQLDSHTLANASWAQPSGLSLNGSDLYIADSESSSIRKIDLQKQTTSTIVGGSWSDPHNLFVFGDIDGSKETALLQHPLAVCWLEDLNRLIVADTFNHRLKIVDPTTSSCKAWIGSGEKGMKNAKALQASFYEPSGLAYCQKDKKLYVADTNNHAIRVIDMQTLQVNTLHVKAP